MQSDPARRPTDPDLIVDLVLKHLNISVEQLDSKARIHPLPMARSIIIHAIRTSTDLSYPQAARLIGMRNHSTAITAENRLLRGHYDKLIKLNIKEATDAKDYTRWVCQQASEASQFVAYAA